VRSRLEDPAYDLEHSDTVTAGRAGPKAA
jgi:hypothetical protein